ncbi:hypothetical protein [Chitinophaga sp. ARDCPP14]|uniref:hypothetical protein n=1 Tax=Chitinophaga sp. ARDCPP14 TaxID=3391139 RepID=UPI003F51F16B
MEKITDFFYDLRDRTSNPLFVSFIIAWLVYNWKIPVVLTLYHLGDLQLEGYKSYVQYISGNLEPWRSFFTPFCYAVGYTLFFPPIRMFIMAFMTLIKTKSNSWNLEISKTGKISSAHFIKLRQKYIDQTKLVSDVIENESSAIQKLAEINDKVNVLQHDLSVQKQIHTELSGKIEAIDQYTTPSILNGYWKYKYRSHPGSINLSFEYYFIDGEIFHISDDIDRIKVKAFDIHHFCFNIKTNEFVFIRNPIGGGTPEIQFLKFAQAMNVMEGNDQLGAAISYSRLGESAILTT